MLLSSINSLDYALDVVNNNKKNELNLDSNAYQNLNQDENIEEVINSNALNLNETESNNNNINKEEYIIPRRRNKKGFSINCLFSYLTNFFKLIGPLFCLTIFTFLIYTYISIMKNIFPYWYKNYISYEKHQIFYFIFKFIISLELFLTLFNFSLAIIIKPGSVSDLKKSKYYKTHNPYYSEKLLFPSSIINKNYDITWKICKYCNEIKPLRTHHCSLCGICVIKMDHHCPWINNCIGQNNQRYFLLFLFHAFCYTFCATLLTLPILIFHKKNNRYREDVIISNSNINMKEINYLSLLGITSLAVEMFFSGWNWFLAYSGKTTLEFWADKTDYEINGGFRDFSFGSWRKNLYYVFGTENLFKILFLPNIKKLPFTGLEFSRLADKNFFIDGIK